MKRFFKYSRLFIYINFYIFLLKPLSDTKTDFSKTFIKLLNNSGYKIGTILDDEALVKNKKTINPILIYDDDQILDEEVSREILNSVLKGMNREIVKLPNNTFIIKKRDKQIYQFNFKTSDYYSVYYLNLIRERIQNDVSIFLQKDDDSWFCIGDDLVAYIHCDSSFFPILDSYFKNILSNLNSRKNISYQLSSFCFCNYEVDKEKKYLKSSFHNVTVDKKSVHFDDIEENTKKNTITSSFKNENINESKFHGFLFNINKILEEENGDIYFFDNQNNILTVFTSNNKHVQINEYIESLNKTAEMMVNLSITVINVSSSDVKKNIDPILIQNIAYIIDKKFNDNRNNSLSFSVIDIIEELLQQEGFENFETLFSINFTTINKKKSFLTSFNEKNRIPFISSEKDFSKKRQKKRNYNLSEYQISLTPMIDNNKIFLDLDLELSSINNTENQNNNTIKINTILENNKNNLILGMKLNKTCENKVKSIPIYIPFIHRLFPKKTEKEITSNILIIIKGSIINK
jgi:hypothetical protein